MQKEPHQQRSLKYLGERKRKKRERRKKMEEAKKKRINGRKEALMALSALWLQVCAVVKLFDGVGWVQSIEPKQKRCM